MSSKRRNQEKRTFRYNTDPEFRAKMNRKARDRYRLRHGIPLDEPLYAKQSTGIDGSAKVMALAKGCAKKRGLSWELSKDQLVELRSKPCTYCGGDLPKTGSGLDRLDNAKGYTLDNVVSCCTSCNRTRGDRLTHEEMHHVVKCLREYRQAQGKG